VRTGVNWRCQLAIVGGGILGRVVAYLAGLAGWEDVIVFQSGDGTALTADSQRNHSWFQSGLLYGASNPVAAEKMMLSGKNLMRAAAVPEPTDRGIFRTDRRDADDLLGRSEALRIKVRRMSQDEALDALGPFYVDGFEHFSVPDTVMDEATILQRLQLRAQGFGVSFRVAKITARRSNGYTFLDVDGRQLQPSRLLLCAGAGNVALLEQLELDSPLHIFQSPLLVMNCGVAMKVPLLADISKSMSTSGLTVVQHGACAEDPIGRCVIGNRGRIEIARQAIPSNRILSKPEQLELLSLVPAALVGCRHRFTAGWKTEAMNSGVSSIDPWIGEWAECPDVLAAVPGKATLSYHVARKVIERLGPPCSVPDSGVDTSAGKPVSSATPMHHFTQFDDVVDEREGTNDEKKKK
jgi:FAD dependent oxidoreductase